MVKQQLELWRDLPEVVRKAMKIAFFWLLLVVLSINPMGSRMLTSIQNQEFLSFHLKDLITYFGGSNQKPGEITLTTGTYEAQKDGALFGAARGRNLIVIQVEALQNLVIGKTYEDQEITPVLNQLLEEDTFYFDQYFQQLGSGNTSDAEFATNNGFPGSIRSFTYDLYQNNYFYGLPWILKEEGYETAAFHGYDRTFWNREAAYPGQGFDRFFHDGDFKSDGLVSLGGTTGISDQAFYTQSIPYLKSLKQPFYSFFITLSNHHPFQLPRSLQALELAPEDKNTLFGDYLQSVHYTDQAIGTFLKQLKKNKLYENSVIVIYGDHFGLPGTDAAVSKRVSAFLGKEYDMASMMNIPLLIHIPGVDQQQTISVTGGQSDFLPTIAYLMGVESLPTLYFGQNLFLAESGFVPEQTFLLKGSFLRDDRVFEMSRDGVFENSKAWNFKTGLPVPLSEMETDFERARSLMEQANFYLEEDVIRKAMVEGRSIDEILSGSANPVLHEELVALSGAPNGKRQVINSKEGLSRSYAQGYRTILVETALEKKDTENRILIKELISWMASHPDAKILVSTRPGELVETAQMLWEKETVRDRIIPVLRDLEDHTKTEYTGFRRFLFAPDAGKYTLAQIKSFIRLNRPWAVALPADTDETVLQSLVQDQATFFYFHPVDDPLKLEQLQLLGVDGGVTHSLQTWKQLSSRQVVLQWEGR